MRKREILLVTIAAGFLVSFLFGKNVMPARGQARTEPSFAAIPSEKGGQDVFGAYDIAKDWPKPLSGVPGNEKWT